MMQTLSKEKDTTLSLPRNTSYIYPFAACVLYGAFSNYFFLSVIAGFVLSVIVKELLKPFMPAALLYFFIFHWAQIFTVIPYLDFLGGNLDHNGEFVDISLDTYRSQFLVAMSLLQVGLMAIVVGLFVKKISGLGAFSIKRAAMQLNTKKVIIAFFASTVIFPSLVVLNAGNPSVIQLVQSAAFIRKIFLVLLIFILFTKKDRLNPLIIFILIAEFILSFTAFFSEFKDIILFVLIVYLTVNRTLKPRLLFGMLPFVMILGFVLIFWSYVKPSYRDFVSGGTRTQVVYVSKEEALGYLWDSMKSFDRKTFNEGVEILLERIETMTLYFKVYDRVPAQILHTQGENVMSSIKFLTLPRSLNPDKAVLDPSTKATYYTGILFANAEQGTSIAMGYFPDFYIDFGIYGMIIPLLVIAFIIGAASKYILERKKYNPLFNYAMLVGIVFSWGTLDSDLTFFLGAFRNLLVIYVLGNLTFFSWINRFITYRQNDES